MEDDELIPRLVRALPELRELAAESSPVDCRTRARARIAVQAIADRIQRAASRDLDRPQPAE